MAFRILSPIKTIKIQSTMKQTTFILALSAILFSCTKENVLPATNNAQVSTSVSDNSAAASSVSFTSSAVNTIYLTPGLNTLQTDSFSIEGQACSASKFVFKTSNNPSLSRFAFYINGGLVKSDISYSENTITVVVKKKMILNPGSYNFILQGRTSGVSGSTFSMSLEQAEFLDINRLFINVFNLPVTGNNFILN